MSSTREDTERPRLTLKELIERKKYLDVGWLCLLYLISAPIMLVVCLIAVPILIVGWTLGLVVALASRPWIKPKSE